MEDIVDGNAFFWINSILGRKISQNSGNYPTKDKKVIGKLDRIFIFEKIKEVIHRTWPRLNDAGNRNRTVDRQGARPIETREVSR